MQTRWVLLVCVAACGGGGSAKEKAVCDRGASLCGVEDDVKECYSDLADSKKVMGSGYDKFLDCADAATSCGEYLGCWAGGLGNQAIDQLDGLGKGMKKMMKDNIERVGHSFDDDDVLPGACKRIDKVCAPDEPFIRRHCSRLVGNLGEDKARVAELRTCVDASTNCFALKKCVDQMETKMESL